MRLILLLMFIVGCGSDGGTEYRQPPISNNGSGGGNQNGGNQGGRTSFTEAQGIMNQYCASCHSNAGFLQSGAALRQSSVRSRVANRTMPTLNAPRQMPDADRNRLLNFF